MTQVAAFYDQHPITEQQIRSALQRAGKDPDHVQPPDLFPFDQDHYGGLAAVDRLIETTGITATSRVLDVCSGMGGPARYLAHRTDAAVVGVDLTTSRTLGARRLTAAAGLDRLVHFVNADATGLPFATASFDAAIAQEAFLHIADKPALFAELFRVLGAGGRLAFTDWTGFPGLDTAARARLADDIAAQAIHDPARYCAFIEAAGFTEVATIDLSAEWQSILRDRLEMFRAMGPDTIRQHGEAAHARYISAYEFFVARITAGDLGGGLFTAAKP